MDCERIRKEFQNEMQVLITKYQGQGISKDVLENILIENTNFVMFSMLKECLAFSRGTQP